MPGTIVDAAKQNQEMTIFCDLQGGINKWPGDGALVYAGSITHKFNLWIPDRDSQTSQEIIRLIQTRYAKTGRGYVYIKGTLKMYPNNENGKPEIVLTNLNQLSDFPV